MNRSGIRETVKMHLSLIPGAISKFSDSFLNKLIEKEHTDVILKSRALFKSTDVSPMALEQLTTEQLEVIETEAGIGIDVNVLTEYVNLSDVSDLYEIKTVRIDGKAIPLLKYENLDDISTLTEQTSDKYYYISANYMFFINTNNADATLYYLAKPAAITSDTAVLELADEFEDAVVYGVLKRLSSSIKEINYNIVFREYAEALSFAKKHYRKKAVDEVGQVIPNDF